MWQSQHTPRQTVTVAARFKLDLDPSKWASQ